MQHNNNGLMSENTCVRRIDSVDWLLYFRSKDQPKEMMAVIEQYSSSSSSSSRVVT